MLFDVVNHKMQPASTLVEQPVLASTAVRKKPVFLPELGKFFRELREAKEWSLRGSASIARRKRLAPPLTYQKVFELEHGTTKNPKPEVIAAMAVLYQLDRDALIARMTSEQHKNAYGTESAAPNANKGVAIAEDSAQISDLKGRIAAFEEIVKRLQSLSEISRTVTGDRRQGGEAAQGSRGSGRRYRGPDRRSPQKI